MLEIGWFSTGRGEGSQGLLRFIQERILRGQLDARIQFVFSNRAPGEAEGSDRYFQLVQDYGLPLLHLSSAQFRRDRGGPIARHREEFDRRVMDLLAGRQPDICVLAGYMLIVGGTMCRSYSLLNLHPALPDGPTGTWQEVIWSLIEQRARKGHWRELEQEDLDRIKASYGEEFPLFQQIRQAEYRREPYLLLETLRAVAEGRVVIREGQVLDRHGLPLTQTHPQGLDLDQEIDRAMAQDLSQDLFQHPTGEAG